MDTFKKIYLIMIILTVFALGTIALVDTGTISQYGETGSIMFLLATELIVGLLIMSRIANIFGNRQNLFVGYLSAFITLIYMLLVILYVILIATKSYDALKNMMDIMSFFGKVEMFVLVNVLVFEIPYVNDTHKKIQYVIAGIISILLIVSFAQGEKNDSFTKYYSTTIYEENTNETSEDLMKIVTYGCVAMFFINPMLRVWWIDKDYYNARDIYDVENTPTQLTVNDMGKVHTNNSYLDKPAVDPNAQPTIPVNPQSNDNGVAVERENEPRKIIPHQADDIIPDEEEFSEPVINKNYKPTDISEVMIPSVDGTTPTDNNTNT